MQTYLINAWDRIRASYWFVPAICALAAMATAFVMPRVDEALDARWPGALPEAVTTTTNAARATLAAIAGAMVTVTGTVFSITIVTLSLASQQLGPRLLRRFMYDVPTQFTLGILLGTSLYCLLVLRVVEHHDSGLVAPHVSVALAVALAVLSMAMLIVFIHHIATLIQAPEVVATVARDLDDAIDRMFPQQLGQPLSRGAMTAGDGRAQASQLRQGSQVIHSDDEGYVQAVAADDVLKLACQHDVVLRFRMRPGHFVAREAPLAEVWPRTGMIDDPALQNLQAGINQAVIVGNRRTPRQDVECAIDELVEVAVRSLSPSFNDPFTAMTCVDRLAASLGRVAERDIPSGYRADDLGRLRVIADPVTFAGMLGAAFNQIRQYGRESVAVTIRLIEALTDIRQRAHRAADQEAIHEQVTMIGSLRHSIPCERDRQDIETRLDRFRQIGGTGSYSSPAAISE